MLRAHKKKLLFAAKHEETDEIRAWVLRGKQPKTVYCRTDTHRELRAFYLLAVWSGSFRGHIGGGGGGRGDGDGALFNRALR